MPISVPGTAKSSHSRLRACAPGELLAHHQHGADHRDEAGDEVAMYGPRHRRRSRLAALQRFDDVAVVKV